MALRVVQPGSGSVRPLVLVYLLPHDDSAFRFPANVAVVADTGPPQATLDVLQNYYAASVPLLDATLAMLTQQLGATFSPVVIAGFSAGGFAVKRLLTLGGDPDAVVLADATYGTDLTAWTKYAQRAIRGERVFIASHSSNVFMEPNRPSPWRNLRTITGFNLPLGDGPGVAPRPSDAPVTRVPAVMRVGNAIVHSYPDLIHSNQGVVVLPTVLLPEALNLTTKTSEPSRSYWWVAIVGAATGLVGYLWWTKQHTPRRLAYVRNPLPLPGDVGLGRAVEADVVFETCVPVTFRFMHNTDPSPYMQKLFSQDVEPAGVYMIHVPGDHAPPSGWIAGTMHFDCPLILELNLNPDLVYGPLDWKQRLYKTTRKKHLALSKYLLSLGYDGIITVRNGETSEIVDLRPTRTWTRRRPRS